MLWLCFLHENLGRIFIRVSQWISLSEDLSAEQGKYMCFEKIHWLSWLDQSYSRTCSFMSLCFSCKAKAHAMWTTCYQSRSSLLQWLRFFEVLGETEIFIMVSRWFLNLSILANTPFVSHFIDCEISSLKRHSQHRKHRGSRTHNQSSGSHGLPWTCKQVVISVVIQRIRLLGNTSSPSLSLCLLFCVL